ncbi:MAG: fibronectin type III domain-containing protein [Eggerthellaceae bacterium]|nr:fibronectin type III domain-containing protein [Eggerthellaceae bacterium]
MGSTSIMKRFTTVALSAVLAIGLMPALVQPGMAEAAELSTGTVATQAKQLKVTKVTGLKMTDRTKKTITLKWDKQEKATEYQVRYVAWGEKCKSIKTKKRTIELEGLRANQKCKVKVRAYCKGGPSDGLTPDWGAWSDRLEVTTKK